jgi:arsenate reductase-like glutaredoxin family protein
MGKLGIKINKNVFSSGAKKFAEGDQFDNVQLPNGRYIVAFVKGRAVEAKGKPSVVLDFIVGKDHEEFAGQRGSIFYNLSEEHSVWLFRALAKLGFEVDSLDEEGLAEILEQLEASPVVARIVAKEKDDFTNYNIDKKVDRDISEVMPEGAAAEATEEQEQEQEEETKEEPEGDDLAELSRDELKKILTKEKIDFKVFKNTEDDAIRDAIREARGGKQEEEQEEEETKEEEPEGESVELKVGDKCTVTHRGKEHAGAKVKSIDEKTGKIKVELKDKTVVIVTAEQITV